AGRDVDVVVADRDVGDDLELRAALEQPCVDAISERAHHALLVGEPAGQRIRVELDVLLVRFDLAMRAQIIERLVEYFARDQDTGLHFMFRFVWESTSRRYDSAFPGSCVRSNARGLRAVITRIERPFVGRLACLRGRTRKRAPAPPSGTLKPAQRVRV